MRKLSISMFALAIVFALTSAFASKENSFTDVYKSFAVAPAGAQVTDAEDLYTSYVGEEIEAETSSPTIQDQQDLIDAAESHFGLPSALICNDPDPEYLCLVMIRKINSVPPIYEISFFIIGIWTVN